MNDDIKNPENPNEAPATLPENPQEEVVVVNSTVKTPAEIEAEEEDLKPRLERLGGEPARTSHQKNLLVCSSPGRFTLTHAGGCVRVAPPKKMLEYP